MTGFIYAMLSDSNMVKIGWSSDPVRRLAKINSDTASPARLVGVVPGTKEQEAELLLLLAPWRSHGSWFHWGSAAIEALLEMMPKPAPRVRVELDEGIRSYLAKNALTQAAFAALIGVKQATVARYAAGTRFPKKKHLQAIARATGGEVTPNILLRALRPTAETEAA